MSVRNVVAIFGICWLLPFVVLTDFFPFVRFGMFAEPVKSSGQVEQFVILAQKVTQKTEINEQLMGLHKGQLDYLYRNYYYRHQSDLLLKRVAGLVPKKSGIKCLSLYRLTRPLAQPNADSVLVATYNIQ